MLQKKTSITRNKLYNSIIASRIELDTNNIDNSCKKITKQLSLSKLDVINNPSIYHIESLYRDNENDKYELFIRNKNRMKPDI
jgi:hypothetical protein